IGEMPIELQPKLLRVLEDRVVKRIGASKPTQIDARVIAATNRQLRQAVNRGRFRDDLFYRLAVMRLEIPPLRERREDMGMLVTRFYEPFAEADPQALERLIEALSAQEWPGNVRELRSAVERAVVTGDWAFSTSKRLPRSPRSAHGPITPPAADDPLRLEA